MKYFVVFLILIGFVIPSVAFAQYLGGVDFYHLPLTVESKQYSVLAQSNTNYFNGVTYDKEAGSLIFSTSRSEDFIDTYTITMNGQTFSELLATDYAKTPDSMLVLINGVEQPYQTFKDNEIISWMFYASILSDEVELIPSTPAFGTGTYKFDDIPTSAPKIYPPLKQIKLGISIDEIQCKKNMVLLQKHDGTPACVKPNSVIDLIKRNWLVTEDVGGYAIDYDGDVKHLPFADVCTNEMKIILLTHSNISSTDEKFVMDDVTLPSGMNQKDFQRCADATSFTKERWNMATMENPEPTPEPEPTPDSESLQQQKKQQEKLHVQEIVQRDTRGTENKINAIKEYRDEFETGYFLEQFIHPNQENFEKDRLMNFIYGEWGFQPKENTSPKVTVYFRSYDNYDKIEKINEWQKPKDHDVFAISPDPDGFLIMDLWGMPPATGIHETCTIPGEYRVSASNPEDKSKVEWGYFTCQRDKLVGESQPWMELPD